LDRLVSGLTKLDTDRIRVFFFDYRSDKLGALFGYMSGTDENEFLFVKVKAVG